MTHFSDQTNKPLVSVIMAVFNGKAYVDEAIGSITAQTLHNIEFIIVDDGSNDGTTELLHEWSKRDNRIHVLTNETNQGLTYSLRLASERAQGKYLARMDADDVALPERLEKQVNALAADATVKCVGCDVLIIDAKGRTIKKVVMPREDLCAKLFKRNCLVHGSLLFERAAFEEVGGYNPRFRYAQDYDLLLCLAEKYTVSAVNEELYKLRVTGQNLSSKKLFRQLYYTALAKYEHELRMRERELSFLERWMVFLTQFFYTWVIIYKFGLPKLAAFFRK